MGRQILIVDDSATVRKFVAVSLGMQGFNVVAACDGMDALEKMPQSNFDLIITDLNMPNMDGFGLIKALRENDQYKSLPIIILTSLTDQGSKDLGVELGASSYLIKPFSLEKIQYEVTKYISWAEQ
jgi:two-component system, chemotaxis family, chemotaxis protein CheY